MNKAYRLKRRSQYAYVYKKGKWVSQRCLLLVYTATKSQNPLIGFSVGKKIGKAVKRNRLRRQLKECARELLPRIKGGFNCIFVAKEGLKSDYAKLLSLVAKLLADADLLKDRP